MQRLWCWTPYRKRPALLKSLSALSFSLIFFLSTLPFLFLFFPFGLQGLRTQALKDYQTHPFQKHWALKLHSHLAVCMCAGVCWCVRERLKSRNFYPLCLLREKNVWEEKQKERCGWRRELGEGEYEEQIEWWLLTNTDTEKEAKSRVLAYSQLVPPYSFCCESWLRKDLSERRRKKREMTGKYRNWQWGSIKEREDKGQNRRKNYYKRGAVREKTDK